LIKFYSACEIFNVAQNDVACRLFISTLKEYVSEWFYSLLPGTITSWDVLENSFVERYFSRKDPYSLFLKLVEIGMNKEETIKDFSFRFMKVLHEIPQEMFPNDVIIFSCYENSLPTNLRFLLRQEGKHSWKELMQRAQLIERFVLEIGANILDPPKFIQNNGGMNLEENFEEKIYIYFFFFFFRS
jgi:hypothetical protein